ncbi:DUF5366 family protein [Bacillus sp. FJAT-45350]|uniref:DUF5366 family protein n=1 Tax=Bacillus sp. FJAT-45350 TaxID=2011014 RepID=UPI000BB69856|nr:DUF5366 family protein [Bacillus sp. FJAT-45350]
MKNAYLTSHFPLFSIVLFSISFALFTEGYIVGILIELGIYDGMMEFFSEGGIKLTFLFLLWLFFFMLFSALKLIADTTIEISLLFFSKDEEGNDLHKIRSGSWIYLISSALSLALVQNITLLVALFAICTFTYFIYFVYRVSDSLTFVGTVGMIFFHILFWFTFTLTVVYALLKLYNSFIASLPL